MSDAICRYGDSIYQHGLHNDRIYLMKLSMKDVPDIIPFFEKISQKKGYSKIFVKVPSSASHEFLSRGYGVEASIPGLFRGREDGIFLARYPGKKRSFADDMDEIRWVVSESSRRGREHSKTDLPEGYLLRRCGPGNAGEISALYAKTYESYPFPINDPGYIRETMQDNFRYFSVQRDAKIVAVASTEIDIGERNVELTDFATDARHTGLNLAGHLLDWMECEMRDEGIRIAYTIARALSFPINITFSRAGYHYGGTLLNNTNICGSKESMNVWYKEL